ncbi:MAG: ribonuclease III [Acidimicrobiia bacterium]
MNASEFGLLEDALGWSFRDATVLVRSLTHRSYCAEHPETESNERLEFLGDAVLDLVVTDDIFRRFPDLPEGELAKLRAAVVNAETLAEVAAGIDLGVYVLLGKGEDSSGGRTKPSILADAMEAVLAGVYLDGGWEAVASVVHRHFDARISDAAAGPGGQDYKTRLQELAARLYEHLPRYRVQHEGPDHDKRFFASVALGGVERGRGEGRSKKQAEQAAARAAWTWLRSEAAREAGAPSDNGETSDATERVDGVASAMAPAGGGHDA